MFDKIFRVQVIQLPNGKFAAKAEGLMMGEQAKGQTGEFSTFDEADQLAQSWLAQNKAKVVKTYQNNPE